MSTIRLGLAKPANPLFLRRSIYRRQHEFRETHKCALRDTKFRNRPPPGGRTYTRPRAGRAVLRCAAKQGAAECHENAALAASRVRAVARRLVGR